ncbi:E3 ubiquitin-protein ligase [Morus notabilis]|uniref:U-box domain-containing protein n=2 Tax=Morus notabilis TaxID=981085 RepID=W9S3P8_9ROSA|nr:E3 ubiquitin-protein ligase [Morus notabilis]
MKDPVTAITGITYDRESIEHWLLTSKNTTCPVTKQPLPLSDADLTPNHTLRRLIQAWCSENSSKGVERIPTPKPPLEKAQILKLLKDLDGDHHHQLKAIKRLETLAAENERNRKFMVETSVAKAVFSYIAKYCFLRNQTEGLEQAMSILHYIVRIKNSTNNMNSSSGLTDQNLFENEHVMDSLTWVLSCTFENNKNHIKAHTVFVLKSIVEKGNPNDLSRLKPEFFRNILEVVKNRDKNITHQGLNAALQILLQAGPYGRNRTVMVQYGAVFELVELEINSTERKTTELVFGILFHLCSCADGRAQFLSHKASIFVVSRRILRVSQAVDDRAVMIFSLICRFSGTKQVLREMLECGAVSRLCVLLQVECAGYLKERAREMLKTHSGEWKDSPCIDESHYPR